MVVDLHFSESLKRNGEFKRLYARGKTASNPYLAVYCRRNGRSVNRVGITVGTKVGNAVTRNAVRRRIKEAYRLNERSFCSGYDIVIVSRVRASFADFSKICDSLLSLFAVLKLMGNR